MTETISSEGGVAGYRVLARKYRPIDFSTLIGQEALVRTLSNAVAAGRLAHAYMLAGVRGVGKTTAARIIARCLNCVGPDGAGGPTVEPCGRCAHCQAISEDRHLDVVEQDAASRTSVNDMRELLDGVRYRPVSARYKIYIVDEVHMLSIAAFNALLKTLEEPPKHVKFIFATTEIRKVPVTVLSRCQRFDLRRVSAERLAAHFRAIALAEGANCEDAALTLIARAADGSVRDGLSLLDQAIAHGEGEVSEEKVRAMLGLADREILFDLFEAAMRGDAAAALSRLAEQYAAGADPVTVIGDLLALTHWLTRLKVTPSEAFDPLRSEAARVRGAAMSEALSLGVLTRAWQMLLKVSSEARLAPHPLQAVEMGLVRLAYAADLPTPSEALLHLARTRGDDDPPPSAPAGGDGAGGRTETAEGAGAGAEIPERGLLAGSAPRAAGAPPTFEKLVALFQSKREGSLAHHLERDARLVDYDPAAGRMRLCLGDLAPRDLAGRVMKCLNAWTDVQWSVSVAEAGGEATLFERKLTDVRAHPLVKATLAVFPEASIGTIRDLPETSETLDPEASEAYEPEAQETDDDFMMQGVRQ